MERAKGIEPSSVAWEATALPLSYARTQVMGLDADVGASATFGQAGGNDATVFVSVGNRF